MNEYAIIDIETTGGSSVNHRIIEIAIFIHNGKEVIDQYETLINPSRPIPPYIESFTGITNEMVADAPHFDEIAEKIEEITTHRIFVAHNVNFDYSFLRKEFNDIGIRYKRKKLCTVRLSRHIFPNMPSYGLGSLCYSMNIPIKARHRAGGDGAATVRLFNMLLNHDRDKFIEKSLKQSSREAVLPPNLPKDQFEKLPENTGVYYFYDKHGKILYVGKANNIKERVTSHFLGNTNTQSRQLFMEKIWGVDYEICGNELIALLHESQEIKRYWPPLNRAQKYNSFKYGIFQYFDQVGYHRLAIGRTQRGRDALITFNSLMEARNWLFSNVREFDLCPKYAGLQKSPRECFDHQAGICKGACGFHENTQEYNKKVMTLIDVARQTGRSYAVFGKGRKENESSVVLVEKGRYQGYGYISSKLQVSSPTSIKDYINEGLDTPDIQNILRSYITKTNKDSIIEFDLS